MLKKVKFKIEGIHCESCKTLIETEIDVLPGVKDINVDYINEKASIEYDNDKISLNKVFKEIKKLNYKPRELNKSDSKEDNSSSQKNSSTMKPFLLGVLIPSAIAIVTLGYFWLKSLGGFELMAELNEGNVGYGIIFLIGLLAGFHCVGMCGGLVVAYSASHLKKGDKKSFLPHWQYNTGRVISYAIIGGILGGVGSFFGVNPTFTGVIIIFAGVFMVLMGLSFITNWSVLEKIKLRTPQFIARFLYNQKHTRKAKGPFMIGLLNGFMPCGPLQAMQLYALASGSVSRGAIGMAIYALGTVPLMFGFGAALSSIGQKHIKNIIKVSGVLVLILGIFMLNRGFTNFGFGFSNLSFGDNVAQKEFLVKGDVKEYQVINMDLTYFGYKPNVLYIKKGIPVRWVINVKEMSGCTNAIMIESLGIKKDLRKGENIIEFIPPDNVDEIKFSCWMRMVWGKFVVVDKDIDPTNLDIEKDAVDLPTSGDCSSSSDGGCGCGGSRIKVDR